MSLLTESLSMEASLADGCCGDCGKEMVQLDPGDWCSISLVCASDQKEMQGLADRGVLKVMLQQPK